MGLLCLNARRDQNASSIGGIMSEKTKPGNTKLVQIALLHDQPVPPDYQIAADGLGFAAYAKVLAGAALGTPGPFTIGVFGEWGTGKTSLLQMVKGHLDDQNHIVTVWFNAWRYEQEEHPIVPLVATIVKEIEAKRDLPEKLAVTAKSLVTALRAVAYGFSGKAKIALPGFAEIEAAFVAKDMIDRDEKLRSDPLLDRSLYYQSFERLSALRLSGQLKIVILVDDLDRCFPDQAIKLLESMKLILSQPGFIFMLGVSRRVLEGYLEHRYEKQYGLADFKGAAYLDKIVQLPFPIPPHSGRMEQFSATLLNRLQPSDRKALEEILPLIGVACGNNPRATVRFVNNLLVDKAINLALAQKGLMEEISMPFFAVTRALQQRWPRMFDVLERDPDVCAEVLDYYSDEPSNAPPVEGSRAARAISMLTDLDLRAMLASSHGANWLKEGENRTAAIQFLQTQRDEDARAGHTDLLYLEPDGVTVRIGSERRVSLAGLEAELFRCLYEQAGQVVPFEEMVQRVWSEEYGSDTQAYQSKINTLIQLLRNAIEPDPRMPKYILYVRGKGHRLETGR